jgi:hypothetical protein
LGFHLRQIDYDTVVAHGIVSDIVPPAADGEQEPVDPPEVHARTTSEVLAQRAMTAGRLSIIPFQILRAFS